MTLDLQRLLGDGHEEGRVMTRLPGIGPGAESGGQVLAQGVGVSGGADKLPDLSLLGYTVLSIPISSREWVLSWGTFA